MKFPFAGTTLTRTPMYLRRTVSHIIYIVITLSSTDILLNGRGHKIMFS